MPKRVLQHASFVYRDHKNRLVMAMRGEEHDIPEGEDLERGDKHGAFTPDGKLPAPPPDTSMPPIQVDWSPAEYNRYVDAGSYDEIVTELNKIAPADRPRVAQALIQAEQGRKERARGPLLQALAEVASAKPSELAEAAEEDEDEEPSAADDENLLEYVSTNTIEAITKRAAEHPEIVPGLLAAEESRGNDARKTLIDALNKTGS